MGFSQTLAGSYEKRQYHTCKKCHKLQEIDLTAITSNTVLSFRFNSRFSIVVRFTSTKPMWNLRNSPLIIASTTILIYIAVVRYTGTKGTSNLLAYSIEFQLKNFFYYDDCYQAPDKSWSEIAHNRDFEKNGICEEKQKELSVVKTNAIVEPRAMVIHVKNASITNRAMMASFWLENMTYQAISFPFFIRIVEEESLAQVSIHKFWEYYPVGRDSARFADDGLHKSRACDRK